MKKVISLILALIMVLSLVACGSKSPSNEGGSSSDKDTLVIAVNEDIPGLDPFITNESLTNGYSLLFYDCLLSIDPSTGAVGLGLAESYDIISAEEYVFHLRPGIKFHEGQELKASDVKFSLERTAASTGMASKVSQIDHVEVIDDLTVKIVLNTPSTTILNNLAFVGTSILCEEWCKEHEDNYAINGTGPYKYVQWNPGESLKCERFDDYWGEGGKMKYLEFVVMPEDNARTIALETGDVDVDAYPATISYSRYESASDLDLYSAPSTQVAYLALSCKTVEALKDVRVRQAIAHAIDKQAMIDGFLDGYGYKKTTILGDGQQYCDNSIPEYEYDVDKAKALMAEAGYADGFDLECLLRGESRSVQAAILQEQLSKIGIRLTIAKKESAAYTEYCMNELMQCSLESWQPATSDADNPLRNIMYSKSKASSNDTRYNNPAYDAVLDEAIQETDPVKAQELYSQAQMFVYEDLPIIPLFAHVWSVAVNSHVKGVVIPAVGDAMVYKNMYWE